MNTLCYNCKVSQLIVILLLSSVFAKGQPGRNDLPRYESPLPLPVRLAATFGELRAGHFHAGIDLKTQQKTGFPVRSIDQGYVLRISVSPTGYGNAIYIAHPNGYTSVYGHLEKFAPTIDSLVEIQQYAKKSFAVDWEPLPGQIQVTKGQIIGFSGNTGSSGGPHLHFEIRDTRTQDALNPLDFGIDARDFFRPKIEFLKLYPGDQDGTINGKTGPQRFELAGWGPSYRLQKPDTIAVGGRMAAGVACYDLLNYEPNKNGVWEIEFMADSVPFYNIEMQRIAFADSRYIHAITDYEEYSNTGKWVVWSKKLPGNRLPFANAKGDGTLEIKPGQVTKIQVNVKDQAGNTSTLRFVVKGVPCTEKKPLAASDTSAQKWPVKWDQPVDISWSGLRFQAEAGSFYDNFTLTADSLPEGKNFLSPAYILNEAIIPIHKAVTLSIKPFPYAGKMADKLLIARVDKKGKTSAVGGTFKNGVVTARIRDLGRFAVVVDTIPPKIIPLNFNNKSATDTIQLIRIRISDDFSGIASYTADLNGAWHLMKYDAKNDLLFCSFKKFVTGKNKLSLTVTDQKGNSAKAEYIFYR